MTYDTYLEHAKINADIGLGKQEYIVSTWVGVYYNVDDDYNTLSEITLKSDLIIADKDGVKINIKHDDDCSACITIEEAINNALWTFYQDEINLLSF